MKKPLHPEVEELTLINVLQALADPVRLEIVRCLSQTDERTCGTYYDMKLAKSTLSHHFKVLREAGVVRVRIDGKHRYYSLRKDDVEAAFPGLLSSVLMIEKERW
ncbi:ArsR/SmtB family transcription factor [Bacillus sp. NPDC077027]|uniref:ArsR/SmtB family transcription factor n=1 Tax=Bacillus sp. NPDC077027 TaxID=3390548 RepID=UPI003D03277D